MYFHLLYFGVIVTGNLSPYEFPATITLKDSLMLAEVVKFRFGIF